MCFWIIFICFVVFMVLAFKYGVTFGESAAILGMRIPREWDDYAKKGSKQFKNECHKFSISTDPYNMANVCTYLRIFQRKGLHIELIKDSTVRYNPKEGNYLGTEAWQDKWTRIVFSSDISGKAFCDCIKVIMAAHNFSQSDNKCLSNFKGNDGRIKEKDSFFIYRALYIMHYNIEIKVNDSSMKDYEVKNSNILIERGKPSTIFSYPKEDICISNKLSDLATIKIGSKIYESDIMSTGNYRKIIYLDNISCGDSGLMSKSGLDVENGNIILGLKPPFDIRLMGERAVIAENIIKVEIIDNAINCEYLFLFLKLLCHRLKDSNVNEIKVEDLKLVDVIVIPAHIQREIIRKGMPVQDDTEHLESVFSSYNETYPLLRSVAK